MCGTGTFPHIAGNINYSPGMEWHLMEGTMCGKGTFPHIAGNINHPPLNR